MLDELLQRKLNIERIQALADEPAPAIPNLEMSHEQQGKFIEFLQDMLREKEKEHQEDRELLLDIKKQLAETVQALKESNSNQEKLEKKIAYLQMQLLEKVSEIMTLRYDNETLKARLEIKQKQQFDTKSHNRRKPIRTKNDEEGDDFDCNSSHPSTATGGSETAQPETPAETKIEEEKSCYHGPSRIGVTYHKEVSETAIIHKSDRTKLPEGAVIIGKPREYRIRHAVYRIEEHVYELITYLTPDGQIHKQYFPMDGEEGTEYINQVMPGTHVTLDLVNFSIFQRYQLATPAYRESKELFSELKWKPCRQNLLNWESKAADWLRKLIPALKETALEKGSDLNVDETWHRYQTHFGQEKIYIWCIVNRKANIVIYYFEDYKDEKTGKVIKIGSRKAEILKEFLGDAKIRSLQSDSCASYLYLDDELIDIIHLKCMAHVRAKFYYAELQGSKDATKMLNLIGLLYELEAEYKRQNLDSKTIKARRNDEKTESIVQRIRMKLLELKIQLHQAPETISALLQDAITYLDNAWKEVFAYRQNGDFTIDNMAAERAIKPLANQRKNSLFYCSESGARNAATFNTFIQTCKQMGVPFMSYFKKVMNELKNGRTDYQNLLPATIQL